MKKQLYRAAAATVLGLSLTTGIVAADSIDTTGPDSTNRIHSSVRNKLEVKNRNDVGVSNMNMQHAWSGDATVHHNTTGGGASTGDASNHNTTSTAVSIDNTGAAGAWGGSGSSSNASASIYKTGPDSTNVVRESTKNTVTVDNTNDVEVCNFNMQEASTGDAKVSDNTTGGSASTGSASNTSSTSTTITVKN